MGESSSTWRKFVRDRRTKTIMYIFLFVGMSSISIASMVTIMDSNEWLTTSCFVTNQMRIVNHTIPCACECSCQANNPKYPKCYNPKQEGALILSSECVDTPCLVCDTYPFCDTCKYERYTMKVDFKMYQIKHKEWIDLSTTMGQNDAYTKLTEWKHVPREDGYFPCSYQKNVGVYYQVGGEFGNVVLYSRQAYIVKSFLIICAVGGVLTFLGLTMLILGCSKCSRTEYTSIN